MQPTSILGTTLPVASTTPLRLALVEDDPVIRHLLHQYLDSLPEFNCVLVAESAEAFWAELALCLPPQLVLLDLNLPGQSGLHVLAELGRRLPGVGVLVQTMHDDSDTIHQALRAGASGYVLKGVTSLAAYRQALLDVAQGGAVLSPSVARKALAYFAPALSQQPGLLSAREHEVLQGLVDGLSEKQVAARLGLGLPTVHTHVGKLYRKLRINSRAELLGRALRGEL